MTAPVRLLVGFVFVAAAPLACSGGQVDCRPTFEYRISIDVTELPRAACQVDLRAGANVASYAFETLPELFRPPCSELHAQPPCTPLNGSPQPSWCEASVCSIDIQFKPDVAPNLSDWLGAESFTMEVTCGGVLVKSATVQPVRQICYA